MPEQSSRLRVLLAAFGLTTICLAHLIEPLLRSSHNLVYHWSGRPSTLFGPPVIGFALLYLVMVVLLLSAERPGFWRNLVWATVIVFLPRIVIHFVRVTWPSAMPAWVELPSYCAFALPPVIAAICTRFRGRWCEATIEVTSVVLSFTALSGVLFMGQLLWFWWDARGLNDPSAVHAASTAASSTASPRIIWILMDELSYQQLYEHRDPSLQLPAFDALASESTVFQHVTPTANFTQKAVPSLMSGRTVEEMSSTADGRLLVRTSTHNPLREFNDKDSVFQDALNAGYRTTVVGWFNPYCRILHDVVDSCYWTHSYDPGGSNLDPAETFEWNIVSSSNTLLDSLTILGALQSVFRMPKILDREEPTADDLEQRHLEDYRVLKDAADRALLNRSASFTFLHLPIPHPDGLYNRRTQQFTTDGSTYLDNLVLADRWLTHARKLLESTGQWDSSIVIVMGDHGWRTTMIWEKNPDWSPEEERASLGGKFDERPAYIVKLAGQTSGMRIDTPFNAVRTRALTDELLTGEIRSPEGLKDWVDEQVPSEQTASSY